MSGYEYQYLTEEKVSQLIDEKIANKTKSTVWYDPMSNSYWKANNPKSMQPSYDQFICSGKTVGKGLGNLKGASQTEIDQIRFSGIAPEFADQANRFYSMIDEVRKKHQQGMPLGAGVITTQDYSDIANVMIDATTYELITRDYILEQAVTVKNWNKLVYTSDDTTPYLNEPDVGENDVIDPRSIDYSRFQITLKKAQGHVKASRWADLAIRDHNIVQDNFQVVDADFPRIFATEIATQLANFTNQAAAGTYDALAAGAYHHTNNPTLKFFDYSSTIRTAGGMSNTLAMNSKTALILFQNTYMRAGASSVFGTIPAFENASSRVLTHPMLPGYTIYIDELLPTGSIYQYDKRGINFIRGPTRTATVNDDYGYFTSQIHDRWYGSGIRVTGFGVEQTGAAS